MQPGKPSRIREINLYRKLLRYFLAALVTSLLDGTGHYLYYRYQWSRYGLDHSKEYVYRRSWEENCGLTLSMLVPIILLYAFFKQFFLKKNSKFLVNAILMVLMAFLFFYDDIRLHPGIALFFQRDFDRTLTGWNESFYFISVFLQQSERLIKSAG